MTDSISAKKTASKPAAGIPYYTPAQDPPAGTPTDPSTAPTLFQPLRIRDVTLANRIIVSPMCMYSADDGHLTDWHLVHLGQFALHGAGLTMVEASSVEPRGRISPEDSGLWTDSQIPPLKRITEYIHSQGHKAAIQIAHAGRKASMLTPWVTERRGADSFQGARAEDEGGWPDDVVAPSAIPYSTEAGWPHPKALSTDEVRGVVRAFADSAARAVRAGFDVIEIHSAHGYLLTEFLSPLSNRRDDQYGGSFENRARLVVEIVDAVRAVIPEGMPLFVRISATEWMEWAGQPSWDLPSSIELARLLRDAGVDLLDVSSGGNRPDQKIDIHPYYQVSLAGQIREALAQDTRNGKGSGRRLLIGAVGMISEAEMARGIVQGSDRDTIEVDEEHGQKSQADAVLVARQFMREPNFVLKIANQLGVDVKMPNQYHRAPRGRKE